MTKPTIVEKFADNGEHSHWELIDTDTGRLLWNGDAVLPQSDVIKSVCEHPLGAVIGAKDGTWRFCTKCGEKI